jgi:hypothetical protein
MLQFCQRACPIPNGTAAELLPKPALHRYGDNLSLPNMVTADARYRFGRLLLGHLLSADGARFSHHVCHGLTPRLNQSMAEAGYKVVVSPGM